MPHLMRDHFSFRESVFPMSLFQISSVGNAILRYFVDSRGARLTTFILFFTSYINDEERASKC